MRKGEEEMTIRYLRDADKRPWGCIAVDETTGRVGWSICSPKDKWSPKVARDKAVGRTKAKKGRWPRYYTGKRERDWDFECQLDEMSSYILDRKLTAEWDDTK